MNLATVFPLFSPQFFNQYSLIVFSGVEYQPLLMGQARQVSASKGVIWESALSSFDDKVGTAVFEQLFLGDKKNYWLGNIFESMNAKGRKSFKEYVEHYSGPHTLILFYNSKSDEPLIKKCLERSDVAVISYEQLYAFEQIEFLRTACFSDMSPQKLSALNKLAGSTKRLSIDVWLQMIRYLSVTSMKALSSGQLSFHELIPDEYSLFDLATFFFKRDMVAFYELWEKVRPLYPDIFWISYWSDLTWRAYHATYFMKAGNYTSARKYAYRLPFSFLQYQWKSVDEHELKVLLQHLYNADYAFKRGAFEIPFEVMWAPFFERV